MLGLEFIKEGMWPKGTFKRLQQIFPLKAKKDFFRFSQSEFAKSGYKYFQLFC